MSLPGVFSLHRFFSKSGLHFSVRCRSRHDRRFFRERFDNSSASTTRVIAGGGMRGAVSAAEFGLDLGVEGLRQHGAAGLGLLASSIESDVGHDFRKVAECEIDRRHQAKRWLAGGGRLLQAAERDDLTHRHTH